VNIYDVVRGGGAIVAARDVTGELLTYDGTKWVLWKRAMHNSVDFVDVDCEVDGYFNILRVGIDRTFLETAQDKLEWLSTRALQDKILDFGADDACFIDEEK
jgi:hypothetical protein